MPQLSPELFDHLKRVADQYGGIGYGAYYDRLNLPPIVPVCALGCANWDGGVEKGFPLGLRVAGIEELQSDAAVRRRLVGRDGCRVPFEEWAEELNVTRGPAI